MFYRLDLVSNINYSYSSIKMVYLKLGRYQIRYTHKQHQIVDNSVFESSQIPDTFSRPTIFHKGKGIITLNDYQKHFLNYSF